jgi:AcrR family transcriptional regulator/DNA-binding HxlR family transcriptional regulator
MRVSFDEDTVDRHGVRTPRAAEFQRARLLRAAVDAGYELGFEHTAVSAIVTRAGVSRKTFYELFESRDDCFRAVFEDAFAKVEQVVAPAYEGEDGWSARMRAALIALLRFLEREPEIGELTLAYMAGMGPRDASLRVGVLERLSEVVEDGRRETPGLAPSPLTAEFIVGGVLSVLRAQLSTSPRELTVLVNPLMWMIVLPYRGSASAARELRRKPPAPIEARPRPGRDPLKGLDMRVTYRTARTLDSIAEHPGGSNAEISARVDISDQGQISKLLSRLTRLGLIENTGSGATAGAPNEWYLTDRGKEVNVALKREFSWGARGRPAPSEARSARRLA